MPAAHPFKLYVKATNTAPVAADEIDGINDVTLEGSRDMLETTDFKDTSGCKTRLAGLEDGTFSLDGHFEAGDLPQKLIRDSFDSGATIYFTALIDPTAAAGDQGYRYPVLVESRQVKGSVDGLVELSISLVMNGAKVAV